jgi:hypothetical protein
MGNSGVAIDLSYPMHPSKVVRGQLLMVTLQSSQNLLRCRKIGPKTKPPTPSAITPWPFNLIEKLEPLVRSP